MSAEPAASAVLARLRRARAQQEASRRWIRRLGPPLFALVALVVFTSGRNPGPAIRVVGTTVAVAGLALGGLGALRAPYRRAAVRVIFALMLLASSAALVRLQPDGAGLSGILAGLVLLPPRVPDRFPVAVSVAGIACLVALVIAVSHYSPASALIDVISIIGFPGMMLLARRLGQANQQAEQLLIELQETRAAQAQAARLAERQLLAREMHDVLAHSLSGLMLQLEGARMLATDDPGNPRLPAIIENAHQLGKSGLDEARRAIGVLRDDVLHRRTARHGRWHSRQPLTSRPELCSPAKPAPTGPPRPALRITRRTAQPATHRKPRCPALLSGALLVLAATRYRLQ